MDQTASVRKQYHLWLAEDGIDAWDVDRLIELSQDRPIEAVAVDSITEADTPYWFGGSDVTSRTVDPIPAAS